MVIKSTFKLGGEIINIIVNGNSIFFIGIDGTMTTLKGLRISKGGVIKEFPDLENNENWKDIALERLIVHINNFNTEMEKTNYIKNELIKYGYEPMFFQEGGFRPQKFKNGI